MPRCRPPRGSTVSSTSGSLLGSIIIQRRYTIIVVASAPGITRLNSALLATAASRNDRCSIRASQLCTCHAVEPTQRSTWSQYQDTQGWGGVSQGQATDYHGQATYYYSTLRGPGVRQQAPRHVRLPCWRTRACVQCHAWCPCVLHVAKPLLISELMSQ